MIRVINEEYRIEYFIIIFSLAAAYLIGSIPVGYIIAKKTGNIDIREHGSGNTGSTNIKRILGFRKGLLTQVLDILKGLLPVACFLGIMKIFQVRMDNNLLPSLLALSAICGHDFSIFLGFKGGKGINTTMGSFLLISPYAVIISAAVYFLLRYLTKRVSVGSLAIAVSLPVSALFLNNTLFVQIALITAGLLIVICHYSNIIRLIKGIEPTT